MVDLITVVYGPEVPYLKLQGRSIERYADPSFVNAIHIIVNDENYNIVNQIDKSWWGTYSDKVNIIHYSIYGYSSRVTGWDNQQLCKLLASSKASTPWSIVLDAKTFFVKAFNEQIFFTNGRVSVNDIMASSAFHEAKHCVERMFGGILDKIIGPGGVPFLFHTQTVADMIAKCEELHNNTFPEFFQQHVQWPNLLTEFYLYSGYVKYKYGNIRELYTSGQKWDCVNIADWQIENFDELFNTMRLFKTLTISIQSKAWQLMSEEQKLKYVTLLKTKDLTDDIEDTLEQLNTVVIN